MNARGDLGLDSSIYGTRIAQHAAQARSRQLPPEVVDHAKLHILDTLAAVVSGAKLEHAHGRRGLWRSGESSLRFTGRSGAKFGAHSAKAQHCFACSLW